MRRRTARRGSWRAGAVGRREGQGRHCCGVPPAARPSPAQPEATGRAVPVSAWHGVLACTCWRDPAHPCQAVHARPSCALPGWHLLAAVLGAGFWKWPPLRSPKEHACAKAPALRASVCCIQGCSHSSGGAWCSLAAATKLQPGCGRAPQGGRGCTMFGSWLMAGGESGSRGRRHVQHARCCPQCRPVQVGGEVLLPTRLHAAAAWCGRRLGDLPGTGGGPIQALLPQRAVVARVTRASTAHSREAGSNAAGSNGKKTQQIGTWVARGTGRGVGSDCLLHQAAATAAAASLRQGRAAPAPPLPRPSALVLREQQVGDAAADLELAACGGGGTALFFHSSLPALREGRHTRWAGWAAPEHALARLLPTCPSRRSPAKMAGRVRLGRGARPPPGSHPGRPTGPAPRVAAHTGTHPSLGTRAPPPPGAPGGARGWKVRGAGERVTLAAVQELPQPGGPAPAAPPALVSSCARRPVLAPAAPAPSVAGSALPVAVAQSRQALPAPRAARGGALPHTHGPAPPPPPSTRASSSAWWNFFRNASSSRSASLADCGRSSTPAGAAAAAVLGALSSPEGGGGSPLASTIAGRPVPLRARGAGQPGAGAAAGPPTAAAPDTPSRAPTTHPWRPPPRAARPTGCAGRCGAESRARSRPRAPAGREGTAESEETENE